MSRSRLKCCGLLVSVAIVLAVGCRRGREADGNHGVQLSTTLTMESYTRDRLAELNGPFKQFYFPTLEIYNSDGVLSYKSHNSYHNVQALQELVTGTWVAIPQEGAARLARVVADIPDFRATGSAVSSRHSATVLSVSLAGCGGCEMQDVVLDELRSRLAARSVAILTVHVLERPAN